MLGRGAQGQPWNVAQIGAGLQGQQGPEAPKGAELVALITEQYEDMLIDYGTVVGLRAARKHLDWYAQAAGLNLDKPTRTALLNSEEPGQVVQMISRVFSGEWKAAA